MQRPASQLRDGAWPSAGTGNQLAKAREETALFFKIAKWVQISHEPFYLSWAHHKKVFHFANLYICIAECKPPLWKMTTGHKQHYMSQGLQLQQQTEIGQIMYPIAGTWASVLFNYFCAYWQGFGLCQLSQAVSGRVLGRGIFYNRHYWWGYFILGGRQFTYLIASHPTCCQDWRMTPGLFYLLVKIQPLTSELAFSYARFHNHCYNYFLIKSHSYATKKSKYNVLKCVFGYLLNWWNNKSDIFDAA